MTLYHTFLKRWGFQSVRAALTQYHRLGGLYAQTFISHSPGGWCQHGQVRAILWLHIPYCSSRRRAEGVLGDLFDRNTNPIPCTRAPSAWPKHFPKVLPPTTITLGIRISTYKIFFWWREDRRRQKHLDHSSDQGDKGNFRTPLCCSQSYSPICICIDELTKVLEILIILNLKRRKNYFPSFYYIECWGLVQTADGERNMKIGVNSGLWMFLVKA